MKNISVLMLVMELVCGLICLGFGIYYFVADKTIQGAVFVIAGGICIITGVRTLILVLKEKKGKDDKNDDGKS